MRCARWGTGGIERADVAAPEPPPGWVRLRVVACGICGSDLHSWRRESPVDPEGIPGHEIAAVPGESAGTLGLAADALVAVEPRSACGRCSWCRGGLRNLCPQGLLLGVSAPGGLAEQVLAPRESVHVVPPGVTPRLASLAEPLAVALRAVNRAALEPASRVLVLGAGTIGLLCGLLARERAGIVAISVRHPQQAAAARALGLQALQPDELESWVGAEAPDVVLETVGGHAETLDAAVSCCRAGGRIVVLGLFTGYRAFDARSFLLKELQLLASNTYAADPSRGVEAERKGRGSDNAASEFASAVAILPRLRAELSLLQTHEFPLGLVEEAFACAADKQSGAIKVTVVP